MKRFWLALLSLGLVVAFSLPAFAAPADFWGHLRWRGWYNNNPSMQDNSNPASGGNTSSSAFIEQRLRLGSTIKLLDGVKVNTRLDAVENFWQGARTPYVAGVPQSTSEQQNIQWEIANMEFDTLYGHWLVGYTNAPLGYGTKYWESGEGIRPVVRYTVPVGPVEMRATYEKKAETQSWGNPVLATTNADSDIYALAGRVKWKGQEAGMQWQYLVDNSKRPGASAANAGFTTQLHALQPYFKGKFGPVDLEAEALWVTGDAKKYDNGVAGLPDVKAEGKGAFVNARFNMGPAYIAAAFSYTSGDDHATADKMEGSFAGLFDGASSDGGSTSPKPTLIMTNTTFNNFFGNTANLNLRGADRTNPNALASSNGFGANNDNLLQYTVYGNYSVNKKLDIFGLFTMAKVDKKPYNTAAVPVQFLSDEFGKEANLVAFYKITSQLTYNLQAAYFWTGDYFKGTNAATKVDNTYVLMHALLLEF